MQVVGGVPSDDTDITLDLVASYLPDALAAAAKANYIESVRLDGVAYVNSGFYWTFSDLPITKDNSDDFLYELTLPHIPVGVGRNEGVATLQFKKNNHTSYTAIPLSINQVGYRTSLRKSSNKIYYWPEGQKLKIETPILLNQYTGTVRMISGGIGDLDSEINVPQDYFPQIAEYVSKNLILERNQPQDTANDGAENK